MEYFLIDQIIMNIVKMLSGKKTYIFAVLVGLVAVAQYLNWIPNEVAITLFGLLGAGSVASMRSAINKI